MDLKHLSKLPSKNSAHEGMYLYKHVAALCRDVIRVVVDRSVDLDIYTINMTEEQQVSNLADVIRLIEAGAEAVDVY